MKVQIRHYGRIKNGKLIFDIPDLYSQQILELEGCDIVMQIKKKHEKASLSQYGYYRGCILPLCYESEAFKGMNNKDEIHDYYFATKYLSYKKLIELPGKKPYESTSVRSLADVSKEEMTEFMSRVIADCEVELNIRIPLPELFYNKYYQK